jgi:Txe/YoeB family toxin of Txe-Axe toxin-antitoxin module
MSILDAISQFQNDPFGITGTKNSIQRSLENQIANLRAGANPQNSPSLAAAQSSGMTQNPLELLQQQLFSQINSLPSYRTPLDQLKEQAQSQINAQYDPTIQMLQSNIGSTTKKNHQSQADAKSMYNSLAQDLASQLPAITNQMKQAQDSASKRYSDAASQSQHDYSQQANQQQQILNQLGLQSAQQDASAQNQSDEKYFQNQNNLQKQQSLDALQQQGQSAETYQHNIADTSRLAGTNAAQDLASQLQDYLSQANSQLGGLESEKSSSLSALINQMQAADAQNAQSQRQNQIDNLMKMYNFQLDTQKEMDNQQKNSNLFKGTSGPSGAANYLAQSLGSDRSGTASQILQLINDTMADPNVIAGKHAQLDSSGKGMTDPVTGKPVTIQNTDQYMEDLLRSKMENSYGGYGTGDINSAINALLAYMGKLR